MIVIQLEGRLGNQLFQIAFGYALSIKHKKRLYLSGDINPLFSQQESTAFQNVSFNILNLNQIEKFNKKALNFRYKIITVSQYTIYEEKDILFSPVEFNTKNPTLFKGYWQSEKYFSDFAYKIRLLFSFTPILDNVSRIYMNQIVQSNSVAIHVRRGDYVSVPENLEKHGICSISYYISAEKYINNKVIQPAYFIFTDDFEWVSNNMKSFFPKMVIVDTNNIDSFCWRDMYLMSICKHQIIANSTFSWWGAWLNSNINKVVVAPKQWFVNEELNNSTLDLIPENWVRL
jgi:hypothetical protein